MKLECNKIRELLSDYDSHEISVSEKKLVDEHLKDCEICRLELEKQRTILKNMKNEAHPVQPRFTWFKIPSTDTGFSDKGWLRKFSEFKLQWLVLAPAVLLMVLIFFSRFYSGQKFDDKIKTGQKAEFHLASGELITNDGKFINKSFAELELNKNYICNRAAVMNSSYGSFTIATQSRFIVDKNNLILDKGVILCKINPEANAKFSVKTLQAEIFVTGTKFLVKASEEFTLIDLVNGKLEILTFNDKREIRAPERCQIEGSGKIEIIEIKKKAQNQKVSRGASASTKIASYTNDIDQEVASEVYNVDAKNTVNNKAAAEISAQEGAAVSLEASATDALEDERDYEGVLTPEELLLKD
jgi:hypothetical protein